MVVHAARGERRFDLSLEPARFRNGGLRTFSRPTTLLNYTYAVNGEEIPGFQARGPNRRLFFGDEDDHRNDPGCFFLILGKAGHHFDHFSIQARPFRLFGNGCS